MGLGQESQARHRVPKGAQAAMNTLLKGGGLGGEASRRAEGTRECSPLHEIDTCTPFGCELYYPWPELGTVFL